jgi:hypothetical protein
VAHHPNLFLIPSTMYNSGGKGDQKLLLPAMSPERNK